MSDDREEAGRHQAEEVGHGWRSAPDGIETEFDLSEAEVLLLAKACSTADLLARVDAEVATAPLVESGSVTNL